MQVIKIVTDFHYAFKLKSLSPRSIKGHNESQSLKSITEMQEKKIISVLTHYQTTNFRLFQNERLCR